MTCSHSRAVTIAALVAALCSTSHRADAQPSSVESMPAAPIVITGRVASTISGWDRAAGTIVTYVAVDVTRQIRGPAVPDRVVLKQLGGEVGGIGLWIADQASFRAGEEALLFLSVNARDRTLHTSGLSRGKRALGDAALATLREAAPTTADATADYVAVPPEYDAALADPLAADVSYLPTDGYPARWHQVDDNQPVFVDHPSQLPATWVGSTANATAAINLWRNSGMDLDLRNGGATLGGGCPQAFTGNGRIAVAYNDPCGVQEAPETWVVGGGYYTTGELRTVNGVIFQKFLQGFVVLNNAGPQASSAGCFQDAITHGLGHALGLGHSSGAGAMMATLPSASCASGPRGLAADDTSSITAIYQGIASSPLPPNAPTALTATAQLSTVILNWTAATTGGAAQSHLVDAGNTVSGNFNLGTATVATAGTTTAFTGVPPGTYFVRVRAQNALGTSPPSPQAQVTVGACVPPGAAGTLSALTNNNNVSLQWSASPTGVTQGYRFVVGTAPGLANLLVQDYPASVTSLAAAAAYGTYYVRVHATNSCGVGPPSNEVTVVLQPCTGPPTAPTLQFSVAGNNVALAWNTPAGPAPTSYTLVVGSAPGLANILVLPTGNALTSFGGPVPAGTYYARLLAQNPCGVSAASNEVRVVVPNP